MKKKIFCHFCSSELTRKLFEGRVRPFCNKCNEPLYENPVPASCVVLLNEKKHVLLVKRSVPPMEGFWCLPGGFMELGETPEKTALRELYEETGVTGKIEKLIGVTSHNSEQYETVLITGYLVEEFYGDLISGDDAMDVKFFSTDDLPEIAFISHKGFIRAAEL